MYSCTVGSCRGEAKRNHESLTQKTNEKRTNGTLIIRCDQEALCNW